MAFLVPNNLKCWMGFLPAAAASLTDYNLGLTYEDMKIFYIEVLVNDANAAFTGSTLTLEYDDNASGADTEIEAFTIADNTIRTVADLEALTLTSGIVPSGSRIMATTGAAWATVSDGITIKIWYVSQVAG